MMAKTMNKCRDCLHCEVCELNPFLPEFNRDNVAFCDAFKSREEYVEVVHSSWVLNDDGSGTCKHCHRITKDCWDYDNQMHYCPHCGALMDLEVPCEKSLQ